MLSARTLDSDGDSLFAGWLASGVCEITFQKCTDVASGQSQN